jgi:hypothetical protein
MVNSNQAIHHISSPETLNGPMLIFTTFLTHILMMVFIRYAYCTAN